MLAVVACVLLAAVSTPLPSRVVAVTVYPDRAEVTREAVASVDAGAGEILVGPLPEAMEDNSLRVSGWARAGASLALGDIEVRCVPGLEVRGPELSLAEAEHSRLQQEALALDDRLTRIGRLRDLLGSLQSASASQFAKEMASTELRPQTWQGAFDFLKSNLDDLSEEERATRRARASLADDIGVAERRVAMLKSRRTLAHKLLAVSLESAESAEMTLRFSYAQPGASWGPSYEAAMSPDTGEVTLGLFAWVRQSTGERWGDVRLTLATGAPSLGIDMPQIASLVLGPRLSSAPAEYGNADGGFPIIGHSFQDLLITSPGIVDTETTIRSGATASRDIGRDHGANLAGSQISIAQKLAVAGQVDTVTTFQVPGVVSLDADGQPRRMMVSRVTLPGRREYLAIPSVKPAAYLLARVTAPVGAPLLAGPVKHYVGSTLVGTSAIPAVPPGEEVVLSFGVDERVKVTAHVLPRTTAERGSARVTTHDRRAELTNRTGHPIDIVVKERIPISTSDQIKVSISDQTTRGYTVKATEPGIYEWGFRLQPDEVREIGVAYSVRHPSGMTLAALR